MASAELSLQLALKPLFSLEHYTVNPINPRVSVVIPIHNEAALLERAIADLFRELEHRSIVLYELLLVENGSTDGTLAVLERLARGLPVVRLLRSETASYGYALAAGMRAATGDLIVNFDLDYIDVEFLALATALYSFKLDIIIGSKNLFLQ